MRNLARPFGVLIPLGWIAFWAGAIFLMWRPAYEARLNVGDFSATGDISAGGLARLIATAVCALAIALALPVLLAALMPNRARGRGAERDQERKHEHGEPVATPAAPRIRAEVPTERVRQQGTAPAADERPASLHPASEGQRENLVPPPIPVRDSELAELRARLDRQDEEIRRLREMATQRDASPTVRDERDRVPDGRV